MVSAAKEAISGLEQADTVKLTISWDPQQTLVVRTDLEPGRRGFTTRANLSDGGFNLFVEGVSDMFHIPQRETFPAVEEVG